MSVDCLYRCLYYVDTDSVFTNTHTLAHTHKIQTKLHVDLTTRWTNTWMILKTMFDFSCNAGPSPRCIILWFGTKLRVQAGWTCRHLCPTGRLYACVSRSVRQRILCGCGCGCWCVGTSCATCNSTLSSRDETSHGYPPCPCMMHDVCVCSLSYPMQPHALTLFMKFGLLTAPCIDTVDIMIYIHTQCGSGRILYHHRRPV